MRKVYRRRRAKGRERRGAIRNENEKRKGKKNEWKVREVKGEGNG